jgi:outer membrane protein OmpA-like peptidoglycan-associated protein
MRSQPGSRASVVFLSLCLSAAIARAQAPVEVADLNGTWTFSNGSLIAVVQQRNRLEGRVLVPTPDYVKTWGWTSGELFFEATVAGRDISGRRYVHFPRDLHGRCPTVGTLSTELELQIVNRDAMIGRYRNRIQWTNCAITAGDWISLELTRKQFELTETSSTIGIQLRDGILFDVDRDELKPEAVAVLAEVKSLVIDQQRFVRIVIEGHTDDQGSESHNLDLSGRRARSVARWLSQNGLKRELLEARGFGKTKPAVPNTTNANRARNRRVEIKLVKETIRLGT